MSKSKAEQDAANAIADFQSDVGVSESNEATEEQGSLEDFFPQSVSEQEPEENTENLSESEELESEEEVAEDSETEDVEEAEEAEPELPEVEYVKADGKKIKIDYSDRDHIKRVYQKFAAQTRYQSERDTARKELAEVKESASKNQELIDVLNKSIEDPEEMYRLFTGGKELRDHFKEWQKEEDKFHLMSDAEKKAYNSAKEVAKRQKELEKREAALQRKLKESEEKESNANLASQQSLITGSFEKHRFNEIEDPDKAHKLDTRLWNDVKSRLQDYEVINKEIIDKEMKEASDALRSIIGDFKRKENKKVVEKKKVAAKKAVAKAVSKPKEESDPMVEGLSNFFNF